MLRPVSSRAYTLPPGTIITPRFSEISIGFLIRNKNIFAAINTFIFLETERCVSRSLSQTTSIIAEEASSGVLLQSWLTVTYLTRDRNGYGFAYRDRDGKGIASAWGNDRLICGISCQWQCVRCFKYQKPENTNAYHYLSNTIKQTIAPEARSFWFCGKCVHIRRS